MEPKARYIVIGFFTLISIIGILLMVLWLGAFKVDNKWKNYIVEFHESVVGLSKGSAVQFNGIKIGEVTELKLVGDTNTPYKVHALARINEDVIIKQDTTARLSMVGVTGQAVISLASGNPDSPDLITEDDSPAVIVATPSAISSFLQSGDSVVNNFNESLNSFKKLLSDDNVEEIGRILANVEIITGAIASEERQLKEIISSINEFAEASAEITSSVTKISNSIDHLLTTEGSKVMDQAAKAMNSLQHAALEMQGVVNNNKEKLSRGIMSVESIGPAISEFKSSLSNLNNIMKSFKENPGAYFFRGKELKEYKP